ncbi:MAG: alpha/beta hydrolase [Pirellulales bacterium]
MHYSQPTRRFTDKSRGVVLAGGLAVWLAASSQAAEALPLWDGPAPKAAAAPAEPQPFLDVYLPAEGQANGSALVVCPGGGYGGLALGHEGQEVAQWCNANGIAAFVLHYRLGRQGHHYPTQLIDVQRAIRLVRSKADQYGIDPERLGIMGFSAGGHLASMAATLFKEQPSLPGPEPDAVDAVSARPDLAVLCYPVIALNAPHTHRGSRKNLLGPADDDDLAEQLSTDRRVTAETPPTFLFQTDEDTAVPPENAVGFYLACRRAGVPAELHIYQPGRHGVGLAADQPSVSSWPDRLRDWLRETGFYTAAD